jgi:hypothetical protein
VLGWVDGVLGKVGLGLGLGMGSGRGIGEVRLVSPVVRDDGASAGRREESEAFAAGDDEDDGNEGVELADRGRGGVR